MSKYPNGGKITTNNSESSKGNEANALWNEGISQIYLSSELVRFFCNLVEEDMF